MLVHRTDYAYKLLLNAKIKENSAEQLIIEDILIADLADQMSKKRFEIYSWENKLRIINGGKDTFKNKYDLETIKKIPIEKILDIHGIKNNRGRFALREERTPSCNFNKEKNLWLDRGTQEGGSVIDLYMQINQCNFKEAIKSLNNFI